MPDHDAPAVGGAVGPAAGVPARLAAALVDASHDALFAVDAEGTILAWTWGAENLYGFPAAAVVGRSVFDAVVPPLAREEFMAALRECVSTGSALLECVRCKRDGGEVQVQALLKWVPPAGGEPGFATVSDADVTESRRLEKELSQQVWSLTGVQDFLQSVLDASTDYSIVALDLERRVMAWNAGARYDFGYAVEDAQHRPVVDLVAGPADSDREALAAAFAACLASERLETELTLSRQDRRPFPARVSLTLRRDHFGAPVGFVLIAKDISEERRAEGERRLALERLLEIRRLGEVDKIKTALLNTTSHELATPLTPIRLQLHRLRTAPAGQIAPALRKSLEAIERNFERLSRVIQGMVQVVRMQGGLSVERIRVDLAAAAREAVARNQKAATEAGLALTCEAPEPAAVLGDPERLQQAMQHLLDNALHFTPRGGQVAVAVERAGGRALLRVRDSGPGLRPDQLGQLFQPFSQVHDVSQDTKGGIGIGLYLCRAIAEAHGGQAHAASDGPGRGSRFTIELPVAP